MAKPSSGRNRRRATATDNVVSIGPNTSPQPVHFGHSDLSILGGLLALPGDLPKVHYDPKIGRHRLEIDRDAQCSVLEDLSSRITAVNETIMLIGKLMAGQDPKKGSIGNNEIEALGFTIHGLAHISDELTNAADEISQAVPATGTEARRHG